MKKWGFLIVLIALGYIFLRSSVAMPDPDQTGVPVMELGEAVDGWSAPGREITLDLRNDVYQGDLLLVNKEYPVHAEGVRKDIVRLADERDLDRGYGILDRDIQLSRKVAEAFRQMVEAAGEEGVRYFLISSGYRGFDKQQQLYEEKGSDYALPAGHSEHNLGLSLDIGSSLGAMSEAPEGAWLQENAWKYGFILRYPKNKVNITGIQYEPWHFRYVGLPHSAIMHHKDLVLEQYLELLREEKRIGVELDGIHYSVTYYPATSNANVFIPEKGEYEISGDNMDGVIVTTSNEEQ
ncbi:M15 family metallopeptidase [Paenibacillus sp. JJ-223]|uniref:M15 family metallopeptidase n=1 Tax=Paenibacillus sp. JJ-223 TaxID=2905647 RepID=UPI001F35520A|nr:M15 family metallopeptidase [Paenibacillus sp. JJ-223]CAH1223015.1 D-alanyl-D-alanine carboxypeptidase [Paenibacillus sp. JJ-223]